MAIDDVTAENQVLQALMDAHSALLEHELDRDQRDEALAQIHEAIKRVQEARGQ